MQLSLLFKFKMRDFTVILLHITTCLCFKYTLYNTIHLKYIGISRDHKYFYDKFTVKFDSRYHRKPLLLQLK